MTQFSKPPHDVNGGLSPFTFTVSEQEIKTLNAFLANPLPRASFENTTAQLQGFGVSREWLAEAVEAWKAFDWQARINGVPQFKTAVNSGGEDYSVHFAALFSPNRDAVPILLMHGWPGSFLEFLPILTKVQETYAADPASLPYHLIVPSLPGYIFTEAGPTQDVDTDKAADALHQLMLALGFGPGSHGGLGGGGYVAQGGDVGAGLARSLAVRHPGHEGGCRGALLNMLPMYPPANKDELAPPAETEMVALGRGRAFGQGGTGYAIIQATKPSTIGLAIASSPQGLLAWIGEKMSVWAEKPPPLEEILGNVSLYWLTGCFPTSIWIYRESITGATPKDITVRWSLDEVKIPFGFSHFPYEHSAPPRSWAEATGKISFFRNHDKASL
ncbi:hypothetical protein diail_685 [Diaporthe ilicicola]|nr:hypothetical protein diail_685 [Diaporthe ilicicola]